MTLRGAVVVAGGLLVLVSLHAAVGVLQQPLGLRIALVVLPMLAIALDLRHGLGARRPAQPTDHPVSSHG